MGNLSKKVFAVVLDKQDKQVVERIRAEYNSFSYTPTFHLVAVGPHVSTGDVARVAGIKGTNRDATGVVFKLNSVYSGFTKKALWEWLSDVEGA